MKSLLKVFLLDPYFATLNAYTTSSVAAISPKELRFGFIYSFSREDPKLLPISVFFIPLDNKSLLSLCTNNSYLF